ncbi:MAG TPA: hypothetical protein PLO53_09825, partial [Candidatus Hydrogenedentes bacterium]|nr:hypothetical protein [Candidatus Hydrogenedentota bacterium]
MYKNNKNNFNFLKNVLQVPQKRFSLHLPRNRIPSPACPEKRNKMPIYIGGHFASTPAKQSATPLSRRFMCRDVPGGLFRQNSHIPEDPVMNAAATLPECLAAR